MRKNFILFVVLIVVLLSSCQEKGDYQYVIYMNDGTKTYAWSVSDAGGGIHVFPPHGDCSRCYYLSSSAYKKAEYVGVHNIKEK